MVTLSKTFRFESAHRIAKGYVGKCAQIHGHSWNGELKVECSRLDAMGMGVDFDILKQFNTQIEKDYDHKLLLYKGDTDLVTFCKSHGYDYVLFDDNPTSEVIAKEIYLRAISYFKESYPQISICSVVIEETCTSRCEYGLHE